MKTITPTGQELRVEGTEGRLRGPWGFMLTALGPHGQVRLHTGVLGSFAATGRAAGQDRRDERVREAQYGAARVLAHESTEGVTTFLWAGTHHEVSAAVAGIDVPFEAFVGLLRKFEISDHPGGVRIRPRPAAGTTLSLTLAGNFSTLPCAISVRPVDAVRPALPQHPGRKVDGGVAWHELGSVGGHAVRRAVIANETTVANLETPHPDDPRFARMVQHFRVDLVPTE